MKALWRSFIIFGLILSAPSLSQAQPISSKEALMTAKSLEEAISFHELLNSYQENCIKETVTASCDSDWVTCIDDGWVVELAIKESCNIKHDGRLQLVFVLDSEGSVISTFPELDYIKKADYCLETYDCVCQEGICRNFIHASLEFKNSPSECESCSCQDNSCQNQSAQK